MKKGILLFSAMLMFFGMVEAASASLVKFKMAGDPYSNVNVSVFFATGNAGLVGAVSKTLAGKKFSLDDNESQTLNFFTLTSFGSGAGIYFVDAILAFNKPYDMPGVFNGGLGSFDTYRGRIKDGTLQWSNQPFEYRLGDGNTIQVAFEDGVKLVKGGTATVQATITNLGVLAPVPEPATMFLFGTGLVSFAGFALRLKKK